MLSKASRPNTAEPLEGSPQITATEPLPDQLTYLAPHTGVSVPAPRWLRVCAVSHERDADLKERLESFFSSVWDSAFTLLTLLRGDARGVTCYLGVSKTGASHLEADDFREVLLKRSFEGRLPGSELEEMDHEDERALTQRFAQTKRLALMVGIPTALPTEASDTRAPSDEHEEPSESVSASESESDDASRTDNPRSLIDMAISETKAISSN